MDEEPLFPDFQLQGSLDPNFYETFATISGHPNPEEAAMDFIESIMHDVQAHDHVGSYCGNPVLGYGGKCAMWIEMMEDKSPDVDVWHPRVGRLGRDPIRLRLVTFPSYRPDHESSMTPTSHQSRTINSSMATPFTPRYDAPICTLMVPPSLNLGEVTGMDLDDTRGIVGLATIKGELWLIDYS